MSRRLWDRGGVRDVLIVVLSTGNSPIYGPRTSHNERQPLSGGRHFKRERCLLLCHGFFLGMCLFWKSYYYLIQSSCYDQVLTGVLPYHERSSQEVITDTRAGKRPSRPKDSSQSRRLRDSVWGVIKAGWHDKPNRRCELSVMYRTFSSPSRQRQLGKILPRVASFFQFLQNSESEIQRQVNEMHEVSSSTSPLPKADVTHSVLRTMPRWAGSG